MAVAGHAETAGLNETFLDHDLMPDAAAGGIGGDPVGGGEFGDGLVFGLIVLAQVLDVMVQGKNGLPGVLDLGHAQPLELAHDRGRVVVGHDMIGNQRDVISGVDFLAGIESDGVGLNDFFDDGLGHDGSPWARR